MTPQLIYYTFPLFTIFQNVVFDIAAINMKTAIAVSQLALELDYSKAKYN